ncbi:MAG: ferritin family protein [Phycisphaerae bacterium]|nr:ferritin family protein [Phycisphaerae bacterium]
MNIFEYAKDKEKYSEQFYRQLAESSKAEGLKKIFNMLADEEAHHYEMIDQIKSEYPQQVSNTDVLADAKKFFEKIRKAAGKMATELRGDQEQMLRSNINIKGTHFGGHEINVYKEAQEFERKSRQFYLEKADEVPDERQKEIFRKLAAEEQKHYILLDNIIEMVGRTEQWLENPEWFHIESY